MQGFQKVPVLMYHSVGVLNLEWIWNFLTIPYKIFEDHLRAFQKKGVNAIDLSQLYDYVSSGKPIPPNSIVLTFDDGYLDNWVYAYPLLKKYGFKGTIFINPEFVDPTEDYRPNLEEFWNGKAKENDLSPHGFLSWREIREMEKNGVMDIQSHGVTHTWYFTGPEIIDFRHPGDPYIWMNWNSDRNRKHKYLIENQENLVQFGTPVYEFGKSLEVKRYFPDEELKVILVKYVKENGDVSFFKNREWRSILKRIVEDYRKNNKIIDSFESDEDYERRLLLELCESKNTIERMLNKKVNFLCWPGGGKNEFSIGISKKYYLAYTMSSRGHKKEKNSFEEDPSIIWRIGIPYFGDEKNLNKFKYLPGLYLYWIIKEFKGNIFHRYIRKILKLYYLIKFRCYL